MAYKVVQEDTLFNYLLSHTSKKRNDLKNDLKYSKISINGVITTQFDYPIHVGDIIEFNASKGNQTLIDIIYEDDEFLVINKPCGLLSERTQKEHNKTAFNYAISYLKTKRENAFLVHRLDQYTSGVLMFVKNKKLYDLMTHNWNDLVVTRGYVGIVEGKMDRQHGHIQTYLYESKSQLVKVSTKEGKVAITDYKVLKTNGKYSLLDIRLKTGRKNQIRVHMSYLHHPIIGDDKYGHKQSPIKRLGLHAHLFEFHHPITGKLYSFKANIPDMFLRLF